MISPSAETPSATCNDLLFMLKVVFFGVPQIYHNHNALTGMLTKRSLALFAYLVITNQPQDRGHLADLLWADIGEQQARQNLRYVLYELRKLLGDYLVITRDTLTFAQQQRPCWVDANVFTAHLAQETTVADPVLLQTVLQLYQGEFLNGFSIQNAPGFEEWLLQQRQQFQQQAIRGLLRLSEQSLLCGDYTGGLMATARLLQLAPWQEEAHRYQMRFLAYAGQRLDALAQYATCCQILQAEFGVAPEATTTQLFQAIEAGALTPAALAPTSSNTTALQVNWDTIPQINRLLGRQAELTQLYHWVTKTSQRVIGLFGLAGQGKSALGAELVVQVAEEAATASPGSPNAVDVVIWLTLTTLPALPHLLENWLAQLSKPADFNPNPLPFPGQPPLVTVSKASEKNVETLLQQLLVQLRSRRVLLILDGGETLYGNTGPLTEYQPGWEAFDELLRRLADNEHRSCLLFLSRVMPVTWDRLARRCSAVRTMTLAGLTTDASIAVLEAGGSVSPTTALHALAAQCAGHPQTLVAVRELVHAFGSELLASPALSDLFLANTLLRTLHAHFARFVPMEQTILLHLAAGSTSQTATTLWQQLAHTGTPVTYLEALLTLQRHQWLLPASPGEPLVLSPLMKRFVELHVLAVPVQKTGANALALLDQVTALRLRRSASAEPERQRRAEVSKTIPVTTNSSSPVVSPPLPYPLPYSDIRALPV